VYHYAEAAMREVDSEFWDGMTAVAFTHGFVGSPHIDTENLGCFYGLSLGDFGPPADPTTTTTETTTTTMTTMTTTTGEEAAADKVVMTEEGGGGGDGGGGGGGSYDATCTAGGGEQSQESREGEEGKEGKEGGGGGGCCGLHGAIAVESGVMEVGAYHLLTIVHVVKPRLGCFKASLLPLKRPR
jgi:hypothetical protein